MDHIYGCNVVITENNYKYVSKYAIITENGYILCCNTFNIDSPACVSPTIFLRNPIRSLVCTNYREHNKEYAAAIS